MAAEPAGPDVVSSVVAPDATYVSLNTETPELAKIMPWAGTSHGLQAFLDNLGTIFTRCDNQALNVTTMFASDENVAVFGDFRYKSHSLGKIVSSPFSILVKVTDGKVTCPQFPRGQLRHRRQLPQGRLLDRPDRTRRRAVPGLTLTTNVSVTAVQGAPTAMTIRQLPVVGRPASPPDPAAQDRHRGALHRPRAGPSQVRGLLLR
jgi:ketosteroid isomerase-like protein